jgi:hypothetical protein
VAQLGARLNGIQKVRGSNPLGSTSVLSPDIDSYYKVTLRLPRHARHIPVGMVPQSRRELDKHRDRAHPPSTGGESLNELEKPDLLGDTPDESAASEIPKATH